MIVNNRAASQTGDRCIHPKVIIDIVILERFVRTKQTAKTLNPLMTLGRLLIEWSRPGDFGDFQIP